MGDVSRETLLSLLPDEQARAQAQTYRDLLAVDAVQLGLIGPRESDRIWERHIGNSAWVVVPAPGLVPLHSSVADVGSGAGLPGLVWAIARPDLDVTLIEPLLRRSTFLKRAVAELGLTDRVRVIRERAENIVGKGSWDVVTARAVAPLDRLLTWTFPLLGAGGTLLALKGESAEAEIEAAGSTLARLKADRPQVLACGNPALMTPTRVIVVRHLSTSKG